MKVGSRASAACIAAVLLLVGCTGQVEVQPPADTGTTGGVSSAPAPAPSGSVAPAPSETPVPGPTIAPPPPRPVAPDTLDDPTPEGALSAIRYFYDLYPYAYATGDIEGLKDISGNACGYCMKLMEKVEKLHADGGATSGFVVEIVDATYNDATATPFHYELQVRLRLGDGRIRESRDAPVEDQVSKDAYLALLLDLEDTWEVSKVLKVVDEQD